MSLSGKTYCKCSSYPDRSIFLLAYDTTSNKDRHVNDIIRDGHACVDYDIDWKLSNGGDEGDTMRRRLAEQEQLVFASLLEARNQLAPEYPVLEEPCRILKAFSSSKVSLHIIILQNVFENKVIVGVKGG